MPMIGLLALMVIGVTLTISSFRGPRIEPDRNRANGAYSTLAWLSFGLAIVTALVLLVDDPYMGVGGARRTLLEVNGTKILRPLFFPAVVTLIPLFPRALIWRKRIFAITGTVLTAFCLIGGFSIGLFFLPSAGLLLFAASLANPKSNVAA